MQPEEKLDQTSNKVQLEAIIAALTEGLMVVTLEGEISYANDAVLHMHGAERGAEYGEALGRTVDEYKAKFALSSLKGQPLPAGQQPLERLLQGENFDALPVRVQRRGSEEDDQDWVHECRGLQVLDAKGQPDFAVLILRDVSDEVEAEERFERTFEANPAPAVINRLADLRYVKVNQGFLEMTGFKKEEVIGRTVYDYDVLAGVVNRDLAVARFQAGLTVPQMEAALATQTGATKFVMVAGQPLELADETCMLFSFIDLDERKKAEDAMRESEELFSKAFKLAPNAASISTLADYRILDVNDVFEAVTGYPRAEAVGRTTASLNMWVERSERDLVEAALREGRGYRNAEVKLRTKTGEVLDTLTSAEVVMLNDVPCILSMFQDITARRRSEADLIAAIEEVMKDASWFSRSVVDNLARLKEKRYSPEASGDPVDLTKRERQVFELMCAGWKNRHIAEKLGVAENTVRNYIANIYSKLNVHTRADAILWGRARGIEGPTFNLDKQNS